VFYPFTAADWQGLGLGALTGAGYAATMFLPNCADAGFEIGASSFMVYEWWANPGFTIYERIIGPIPDYAQIVLSIFYMYACFSNNFTALATEMVFWTKYVQSAILPYVYVMTYFNGPRHDLFLTSFSLLK
jgi:hypothetical protein